MIRFDRSATTILVVCVGCPTGWRQLTRSDHGATTAAADHVELAHADPDDDTRRRYLAASRKARSRR
jgi:hypothetical protein